MGHLGLTPEIIYKFGTYIRAKKRRSRRINE
jgi:ketopantoate hydroxymethyltransferase